MNRYYRLIIRLLTTVVLNFFAESATADTDAAAFDDAFGELRLLVFSGETDLPLADVAVSVGGVALGRTNEDGSLSVELFGGLYHFSFDIQGQAPRMAAIRVTPKQTAEVLVEISSGLEDVTLRVEHSVERTLGKVADGDDIAHPMSFVEGTAQDADTGKPIAGARIFVCGSDAEAVADPLGRFRLEVPVGSVDVVMVHPDFSTATLKGVEVRENHIATVKLEAVAGGVKLDDMLVTAPKIEGSAVSILEERRVTTQVTDIIGAEQISKSGDSNAAAALKRVTGVTIVGGKYVYVRGLGERYSATALNGLNLPSPDPERRVVPLDMFPAEILDSLKIQKTYSAEMPGDFGGGMVTLRTRAYPKDLLLKLEVAGGIVTGSTFKDEDFASDKGATDFLGIDGGHRAMSPLLREMTEKAVFQQPSIISPGYSEEELAEGTKSLPENWGMKSKTIPPNLKLAATLGNGWKLPKAELGFLASALYKNEWDTVHIDEREYGLDAEHLALQNRYLTDDATNTVNLGGIFTLGVDFHENNSVVLNTMVDRITDNDFYIYEAFHSDFDARVYNYEWTERMLISQQIIGTHTIEAAKKLKVDWRYGFSTATRDEPDKRFVRYDYADSTRDPGTLRVSTESNANRRDYLTADDRVHDMAVDFSLPFVQWTREAGTVKTGFALTLKNREADIRRFAYYRLDFPDEIMAKPPWAFFVAENMDPGEMRLNEVTESTDNYIGEQNIFAYFLSSNLPLGQGFSSDVGLRLEKAEQTTTTYKVFGDGKDDVVQTMDNLDVLPSVVLTYEIKKGMLLRAGYGKTLNRPDFREMSPGCATGYAGSGRVCGAPSEIDNPAYTPDSPKDVPKRIPYTLKQAVIHNVDLRWEWYFSTDESVSLAAFYKKFLDPVELMFRTSSDKSSELRNADGAQNVGVEMEFKKNFGFVHKRLEDLYVASNAAWIFSRIELPKTNDLIQTNSKRPLQGQSPFVVNAQLGYDNAEIGLSAVLLYNVSGKRIATVGVSNLPDVYEQPFHQLDLVIKQKIKKGFQLGFKAVNLVDLPVEFTQGDEPTKIYRRGREFALSFGYNY